MMMMIPPTSSSLQLEAKHASLRKWVAKRNLYRAQVAYLEGHDVRECDLGPYLAELQRLSGDDAETSKHLKWLKARVDFGEFMVEMFEEKVAELKARELRARVRSCG